MGLYLLYQLVLPGRESLVFPSAMAMALLPALTLAFYVTVNSMTTHPGKPYLSLAVSLLCVVTGLGLSFTFPNALNWSPPRTPGLVSDRIYTDDRGILYAETVKSNEMTNLIMTQGDTTDLKFLPAGVYDPVFHRILFPDGTASRPIPSGHQDIEYFAPPGILVSLFSDINFTHSTLLAKWKKSLNDFILTALAFVLLLSGLLFLFHIHIWPLIKWVLILLGLRGVFFLFRFSFHDAVYMASRWTTDTGILDALPLVITWAAALFLLGLSLFRLPFAPRDKGK